MKRPLNSGLFLCGFTGGAGWFGDCFLNLPKLVALLFVGDEGDGLLLWGRDEAHCFETGLGGYPFGDGSPTVVNGEGDEVGHGFSLP